MIVLGAVLLLPNLQARLALASGPIANWTDATLARRAAAAILVNFRLD